MFTHPLLAKIVLILALAIVLAGTILYRTSARQKAALERMTKGVQAQTDGMKNLKNTLDHYQPK